MEHFLSDHLHPIELYRHDLSSVTPIESFTYWSTNRVLEWRNADSDMQAFKVVVAEAAFLGLTVVGLIESIARIALLLLIRPVDLFVTDGSCIDAFYTYVLSSCSLSVFATFISITEIVTNLLSYKDELAINKSVSNALKWAEDRFLFALGSYRFFAERKVTSPFTGQEFEAYYEKRMREVNPHFNVKSFIQEQKEAYAITLNNSPYTTE